jgi:hypothetical protein
MNQTTTTPKNPNAGHLSWLRTAKTWLRIAPDVINRHPALTYGNDDIRPYWRATGTGSEKLTIEQEPNGSYLLRMFNLGEGGDYTKETWLHLDQDVAEVIGKFLQGKKAMK